MMLKTNPRISVVIACYNEEDKIGGCIGSLLNQSSLPDEIIIVDGGSTDRTVSIIERFMGRSKRIKLLHEVGSKRSPANARNIGWKAAAGDYILFLDADGEFGTNFIELVKCSILGKDSSKNIKIKHSVIDSWKEVFLKYSWYGRTMLKYWRKNKSDYQVLLRAVLSAGLLVMPFLFWSTYAIYLFLFDLALILGIGFKEGVQSYKASGILSFLITMPFYMVFVFISTGIGLTSSLFLHAFGRSKIGR